MECHKVLYLALSYLFSTSMICAMHTFFLFIMFADDTNTFCSASNVKQLECFICRELSKLHLWFSISKLSLNITKTNYILFSGRVRVPDIRIRIKKYTDNKNTRHKIPWRSCR